MAKSEAPYSYRYRGFQESDGDFRHGAVFVSQRSESNRAPQETQNRLEENSATGEGALFSDLRSPFSLCYKAERGRRSRRVGNATAPPERRASLQEVFANEAEDEARSLEKLNRRANEMAPGGEADAFSTAPLCTEVVQ